MNFWESFKVALTALRANKLRSLLTMLGVIIGVGSVIVMISIVQGARQKVIREFEGIGTDLIFIEYAPKREQGQPRGKFEGLKMSDVRAIERRADLIAYLSPRVQQGVTAIRGKEEYQTALIGVTDNYIHVTNVNVERGRFLNREDMDTWNKVCVIGDKARRELFPEGADPIGGRITVQQGSNRVLLTVVGLLEKKGKSTMGVEFDNYIFTPLPMVQKRLSGSEIVSGLSARANAAGASEAAANQVWAVLKERYPDQIKDFVVDTQEGLIQRLDTILGVFQLILGGVGGLSLLVGGIGIMNIMLVSVTERTREIGIRKAVGAKRADILLQFITESMTVSGIGGLIGVAFGYGLSRLVGMAAGDKLPTFVPFWAVGLGFGFATVVGMFFGIYPAFRAARLDPIQALRYE